MCIRDSIYIHYAAPPYSARISAIYLLHFCKVWLGSVSCATPCNEAELRIYAGWVNPPVPFLAFCGPKFTKFCDNNIRDPSCFPMTLLDCLLHVSFRRHSPLSLEVIEKPNKCKCFVAPIFWKDGPTFLRQIVSVIYQPPFRKVWLSLVC